MYIGSVGDVFCLVQCHLCQNVILLLIHCLLTQFIYRRRCNSTHAKFKAIAMKLLFQFRGIIVVLIYVCLKSTTLMSELG